MTSRRRTLEVQIISQVREAMRAEQAMDVYMDSQQYESAGGATSRRNGAIAAAFAACRIMDDEFPPRRERRERA